MITVAAFDFDKTLTTKDQLIPFAIYLNGFLKTGWHMARCLPVLLKRGSRQKVKEQFLSQVFKDKERAELLEKGKEFALAISSFNHDALKKLEYHKAKGDLLVLISANIDLIVLPWGKAAGFQHVICTKTTPSGKIIGENCWGDEKVKRLIETLGPKESYILYAYGDSKGDLPLLNIADHAFYRKFY